jgi:glycerophosphoryl diester phosphodiesterase
MVRIFAHRGAWKEHPENTLAAFRRGVELGADALELDAHHTKDAVVVVSHDPDGARVFGKPRRIAECMWEEVRGWGAPSLEEVIQAFPGVPINVDLKVDCAAAAVETIKRLNAEEQVTLASFSSTTLRRVRSLGYRGPTGLGRGEVARMLALPTVAQRGVLKPPGTAAQLPLNLAQGWIVDRCHALGLRVDVWTVNDAETARRLVKLGVDGIMTDELSVIVPAIHQETRTRP